MTGRDVLRFIWRERGRLLKFLRWTAEIDGLGKRRARDAGDAR